MRVVFCSLLLLAALAGCGVASESDDMTTVHWTRADHAFEPSGNFEPPAAPPALLDTDAAWSSVDLPHVRARRISGQPNATLADRAEVAWYRFTLPDSLRRNGDGDIRLYVPRWQTVGAVAVYADGRLLWRTRGSLIWNDFNRPLWLPLAMTRGEPAPRTILIRMASQKGIGGVLSTARAGPAEALAWRYRVRTLLQTDFLIWSSSAFAILGLFSLAVWCVRRREPLYLIFFALATLSPIWNLRFLTVRQSLPLIPDDWFVWITVNSTPWLLSVMLLFLLRLNHQRLPYLSSGLLGACALFALATAPGLGPAPLGEALSPLLNATMLAFDLLIVGTALWLAWRLRTRLAIVAALWFVMHALLGAHDVLMQSYRIDLEGVYLISHATAGLLTFCLVLIWQRYTGAIRAVEEANSQLGVRLAEQALELTASHEKLRVYEQQQALMRERQRMMREMHDGIGSSLVVALSMAGRDPAIMQVLQECIEELSLSIDSLNIAEPDLLALLATLRYRLEPRLNAAGVTLDWRNVADVPALPWLDTQSALHILRILQEALANCMKHTRATQIAFSTRADAQAVELRLSDNGGATFAFAPFAGDAEPAGIGGKGLTNVIYRTRAIGARCAWERSAEGGVFVLVLPLT